MSTADRGLRQTVWAPGRGGFVAAMVAAQVLTQIGAFTLPALLPGYIERWSLSKTEAGWLVGIFFAAYVPAVPVLLALTDRAAGTPGLPGRHRIDRAVPPRLRHAGRRLLVRHADAGAGRHRLGRSLYARPEGDRRSAGRRGAIARRLLACRRRRHRRSGLLRRRQSVRRAGRTECRLPVRCRRRGRRLRHCGHGDASRPGSPRSDGASGSTARLPAGIPQPRAMAWIVGYTVHTWELAALRAWAVTFLTATAAVSAHRPGCPGRRCCSRWRGWRASRCR